MDLEKIAVEAKSFYGLAEKVISLVAEPPDDDQVKSRARQARAWLLRITTVGIGGEDADALEKYSAAKAEYKMALRKIEDEIREANLELAEKGIRHFRWSFQDHGVSLQTCAAAVAADAAPAESLEATRNGMVGERAYHDGKPIRRLLEVPVGRTVRFAGTAGDWVARRVTENPASYEAGPVANGFLVDDTGQRLRMTANKVMRRAKGRGGNVCGVAHWADAAEGDVKTS